jgi:hypothetical protein
MVAQITTGAPVSATLFVRIFFLFHNQLDVLVFLSEFEVHGFDCGGPGMFGSQTPTDPIFSKKGAMEDLKIG